LWEGDAKAAQKWMEGAYAKERETPELCRIYQYFTSVRAYAVLGNTAKALDLALRLRDLCRKFCRAQDAAEAGVLISALLWAKNDNTEAQHMMESVLLEMQPYGFIRLISNEGAAILRVLKKILFKTENAAYKGNLDPAYVNSVYIAAYAASKQRGGIISQQVKKSVKLSDRQKMIIQLLARGYKRKDIIAKTGLSLGTVKSYIRIIFEKLEADNSAAAVMKARELGIIT
jgi:LuxR family maltose regulon positive regulatory protein